MSGGGSGALGLWGEEQIAGYLAEQGYRIAERRYRCRYGELDLVAERGEILAFVEVKLRSGRWEVPREAVTVRKQEKLRRAAEHYLMEHPCDLQPRFDVAEVWGGPDMDEVRIEYYENAF